MILASFEKYVVKRADLEKEARAVLILKVYIVSCLHYRYLNIGNCCSCLVPKWKIFVSSTCKPLEILLPPFYCQAIISTHSSFHSLPNCTSKYRSTLSNCCTSLKRQRAKAIPICKTKLSKILTRTCCSVIVLPWMFEMQMHRY